MSLNKLNSITYTTKVNKNHRIQCYVNDYTYTRLLEYCDKYGQTVSNVLRNCLIFCLIDEDKKNES